MYILICNYDEFIYFVIKICLNSSLLICCMNDCAITLSCITEVH